MQYVIFLSLSLLTIKMIVHYLSEVMIGHNIQIYPFMSYTINIIGNKQH